MKCTLAFAKEIPYPILVGWVPDNERPSFAHHLQSVKDMAGYHLSDVSLCFVSVQNTFATLPYPLICATAGGQITIALSYEDVIDSSRHIVVERLYGERVDGKQDRHSS